MLINKALIEIPPKFARPAAGVPGLADGASSATGTGATGLAEDVRAYGAVDARRGREAHRPPLPEGDAAGRDEGDGHRLDLGAHRHLPQPACGIEMPLVRSWWLGKKKGKEAYVVPTVVADPAHPSGKRVEFEIGHDAGGRADADTTARSGAQARPASPATSAVSLEYVRARARGWPDRARS